MCLDHCVSMICASAHASLTSAGVSQCPAILSQNFIMVSFLFTKRVVLPSSPYDAKLEVVMGTPSENLQK